ncbi:RHS domain-containing protein [Pendulispora brunnea]|uniref:RHS domain-containing protein n=1 Tax=Pendulispora brunnea TaxID=2905690 RepID=A0ABZ2K0U8_9BACT
MTKLVDRRGYSFHYSYDSRGRCVHSTAEDGVEEVKLEYLEGATIVTLADGGEWVYEHHDGYLSRIIDPYGGEHRRELDDAGQLCAETDEAGRRFEIVRDHTGKGVGRRDSVGHIWAMGESPSEPDAYIAVNAREWEYGALLPEEHGLPIRRYLEVDRLPAHVVNALTPPPTGQMSVDFAERWKETPVQDLQGLPLRTERLDGTRRSWSYDESANRTRFTDADGSSWRWTFTSWNRIHQITNPLGITTELTHSPRLLISRVADPSGMTSEYAYDLKNRLTGVRRNGVVRETYAYDASNELVEKVDGRGKWLLRFQREDEGRLVKLQTATGERHELVYDTARRLSRGTAESPDGKKDTYGFDYDIWGRRTRDHRNAVGVERRFVSDQLAEIRVLGKFLTRYSRNQRNTVQVIDPTGAQHTVQTCHGGVLRRRMSNGMTEVSQYHPNGYCLAKIAYTQQEQRWSRFYERSSEGDVHAIHDSARGIHRFSYDAAHRLVGETLPSGETHAFKYSHGGTLLESPTLRGATVSGQKLYDANGSRLEYDHRDALCARHTPSGTFRLTHDARDQLVSMTGPGFGQWSARYDMLGRRIESTFNGKSTSFYWDSDRLAAEILPDKRLRIYIYIDDLALVPMMFVDYASVDADPKSGTRYFIFANHLGTPEVIQDDTGNVVWRARYEAYGTAHIEIGQDFHQPLRWPGHYFDAPTGLHYVRFRYYSPELGLFLESDPQGIRGGFNLHAYASGNPLRHVDVQGLSSNPCPDPKDPNQQQTPPVKESSQTENAPDAKAPKRPRRQELDGYPPYDPATVAMASRLAGALRNANLTHPPGAVCVIRHKDGSVSVGMSGSVAGQRAARAAIEPELANMKRDGTITGARIGKEQFRTDLGKRADNGDLARPSCAEPRAGDAAMRHPDSPPESMGTVSVPRPGEKKFKPEYADSRDPSQQAMCPCESCGDRGRVIMGQDKPIL